MALWPFGRKKKKGARTEGKDHRDDDEELGISTHISGPEGTTLDRDPPSKTNHCKAFVRKLTKKLSSVDLKMRKGRSRGQSKSNSKPSSRTLSKSRANDLNSPIPPVPERPERTTSPTPIEENSVPSKETRQPLAELQYASEQAPQPPFHNEQNLTSQTSLQPEVFDVKHLPTLRAKKSRTATDGPRTKSTKRKTEEKQREQEIRSMSTPIPVPKRPRSFYNNPLAQDSRKIKNGLNRHLERPLSEISLPVAESLQSSISDAHEMANSYRVSALDALSPRPTIRYSDSPRRFSDVPSRTSTRKDKGPIIPEEGDFSAEARIDDMVNEMDTSTLRQLMERDRRRRERKKKSDHEKLEKRLQRKLEKQKAEMIGDPEIPGDVEMDDTGGTGPSSTKHAAPAPVSPQEESSRQAERRAPAPIPPHSPSSWLQDPSKESIKPEDAVDSRLDSRLDSASEDSKDEPVVETAQAVRMSSASMSPPDSPSLAKARAPANLSVVTPSNSQRQTPSSERPGSERPSTTDVSSNPKESSTGRLKSIFRRGGTKRRAEENRDAPATKGFSNTSRESFSYQQMMNPPIFVERNFRPPNKSGTPQRTRSKFREDLPDFSSPPTSRVHSPDHPVSPSSPYIDDTFKVNAMDDEQRVTTPLGHVHPAFRDEMTLSQSMRSSSPEGPSAALLSHSLASVDSEGSWLSGRPAKRSSAPIESVRESGESLAEAQYKADREEAEAAREVEIGRVVQLIHGHFRAETSQSGHVREGTEDSTAPPEIAFFQRRELGATKQINQAGGLTSQLARSGHVSPAGVSAQLANPDDPTAPHYVKLAGRRKATLVQADDTHQSREALMEVFKAGDDDDDSPLAASVSTMTGNGDEGAGNGHSRKSLEPYEVSPVDPDSPRPAFGAGEPVAEEVSVHRATSVEYGKGHSRRVSAGSARILNIPARSSTSAVGDKRNSSLSYTDSVGSPTIPHSTNEADEKAGKA